MAEDFIASIKDKQDIKDQLGGRDSTRLAISKWKSEELNIINTHVRVYELDLSDSFILDDDVYGIMDDTTPQPYLKNVDEDADWQLISETPNPEVITEAGKQVIISWIKGDNPNAFQYVALGSGSTDFNKNQTSLVSEFKRQQTFTVDK